LPAPGGATSTATFDARSAEVSAGRASSMGRAARMVTDILTEPRGTALAIVSPSQRLGRKMARMGTELGQAGAARVDWVDYAKGFCIIMVVMMHSTLGVEAAAGQQSWM